MNDRTNEIYRRVLARCEPFPIPAIWNAIAAPRECYSPPRFATAMLAELSDEFLELELVVAGVARQTIDGLHVVPALADEDGVLVAMCSDDQSEPSAILGSAGLLGTETCSIEKSLRLVLYGSRDQSPHRRLLVVFSAADLAVLRSIGLPAVMADTVSPKDARELDELRAVCNWPSISTIDADPLWQAAEVVAVSDPSGVTASNSRSADQALEIILLGWSPARLELAAPEGLSKAVRFLQQFERNLRLDLSTVCVWHPMAEEIEGLKFQLTFGNQQSMRDAIEDNLADATLTLDGYERRAVRETRVIDYASAMADVSRLAHDQSSNDGDHQWSQAVAALAESVQKELVAPLFQHAVKADAVTRVPLTAMASVVCLLHAQMPIVHRRIAQATATDDGELHWEALRSYLGTVDRVCNLSKQLRG